MWIFAESWLHPCATQRSVLISLENLSSSLFQLMPLPLTVSCFSKIQIGFTFLVLARPGSPGRSAVKWVCVCLFREIHSSILLTHPLLTCSAKIKFMVDVSKFIKYVMNDVIKTTQCQQYYKIAKNINYLCSMGTSLGFTQIISWVSKYLCNICTYYVRENEVKTNLVLAHLGSPRKKGR